MNFIKGVLDTIEKVHLPCSYLLKIYTCKINELIILNNSSSFKNQEFYTTFSKFRNGSGVHPLN